jgi:hypothetical protein
LRAKASYFGYVIRYAGRAGLGDYVGASAASPSGRGVMAAFKRDGQAIFKREL